MSRGRGVVRHQSRLFLIEGTRPTIAPHVPVATAGAGTTALPVYLDVMCARLRSIDQWSQLPRRFDQAPRLNFAFNPNVAPTETIPVILAQPAGTPSTAIARFGIPATGRDGKPRMPLINVRMDGLRRGQFRDQVRGDRCVVPCQGFYEWREEEGKQPYYFSRADGAPLMMAAIWQEADYKGDTRPAFAILTDEPNELVAAYHDRMPMALADDAIDAWLDLAAPAPLDAARLLDLDLFAVRPMNRAVNSVRQKDLAAIEAA